MNENEVVLTPAEEAAQRAERLSRVEAIENAEKKIQSERVEQVAAATRGVNESFFEREARQAELARSNKPVVLKQRSNADAIKAEQERYPRPVINKPQEGFTDPYGLQPCERKASITLQPLPSKYPSSDPRNGMNEELIIRMGMNPDPTQPA